MLGVVEKQACESRATEQLGPRNDNASMILEFSSVVGMEPGSCIRKMRFGGNGLTKNDLLSSIGRAGDGAPTSYGFTLRDEFVHP